MLAVPERSRNFMIRSEREFSVDIDVQKFLADGVPIHSIPLEV